MLDIELVEAMKSNDPDPVYLAINQVKLRGYDKQLQMELIEAEKWAAKLDRLKQLKLRVNKIERAWYNAAVVCMIKLYILFQVLELSNPTLQELRSYSRPSKQVHQVIQATLLLLGTNEQITQVSLT